MTPDNGRKVVVKLFRPGDPVPDDGSEWPDSTPEERLLAVWELTLNCLAWETFGEPRLQRSVSRVQRGRR